MLNKKMDMDFVLAQRVIQYPKYRNHYPRQNTFKILDNGVYEGEMMDMEDIVEMAGEMLADEVILPDYIMKRMDPIFYKDLIPSLPEHFNYMVVPQGRDPLEWRHSYKELVRIDGVSSIGIPIWLYKEYNARSTVVLHMYRKGELDMSKQHHLLGLDSYWELINYPPGLIRSVDTSMPFSMSYSHIESPMYADPDEHQRVPVDASIESLDLQVLENEIKMLRTVSKLV